VSTSFGLTIAAIIQASEQQLSFFQALQVSNLVWLANFGTFLGLASYSRHRTNQELERKSQSEDVELNASITKQNENNAETNEPEKESGHKPDNNVKLGATVQIIFSMILTFYTWTNYQSFNQDECAPLVKYVAFFAVDFPALQSGKTLALTFTSLLTAGYVFVTLHELYTFYTRHKAPHPKKTDLCIVVQSPLPEPPCGAASPLTSSPNPQSSSGLVAPTQRAAQGSSPSTYDGSSSLSTPSSLGPSSEPRKSRHRSRRHRKRGGSSNLDPMLLGITMFQLVIFTYFIVSTELLLKHNPAVDSASNQWGFGQILALIVVVPCAISVSRAFKEHGLSNLHHRRSK